MELEKETFNALISYLEKHGYPQESFAVEFPIGKYRADLAIIDPDSKELIALFEIKQKRSTDTEAMGRRQLQSFASALEVKSIPMYLVFPREGSPAFEILPVSFTEQKPEDLEQTFTADRIFDFQILRNSAYNLTVSAKKGAKKKQVDVFMWVCLLLAAFVLALFIASTVGTLHLSAEGLILLGIFVGLVLTPYASKIKFASVEFERLNKGENPEKQ